MTKTELCRPLAHNGNKTDISSSGTITGYNDRQWTVSHCGVAACRCWQGRNILSRRVMTVLHSGHSSSLGAQLQQHMTCPHGTNAVSTSASAQIWHCIESRHLTIDSRTSYRQHVGQWRKPTSTSECYLSHDISRLTHEAPTDNTSVSDVNQHQHRSVT